MNSRLKHGLEVGVFPGPNLGAPFAAVAAEFPIPTPAAASRGTLAETIQTLLPETVLPETVLPKTVVAYVQALNWSAPFETVVAALAQALQDWHGRNNLPCRTARTPSGRGRVFLGYHDDQTTSHAMQMGYELALAAYAQEQGPADPNSTLATQIRQLGTMMLGRQPDYLTRSLFRAARSRGIPFYPVVPGQKFWQYGQGRYGLHFFEISDQFNSHTGQMLEKNKVRLLHRHVEPI